MDYKIERLKAAKNIALVAHDKKKMI